MYLSIEHLRTLSIASNINQRIPLVTNGVTSDLEGDHAHGNVVGSDTSTVRIAVHIVSDAIEGLLGLAVGLRPCHP
jgi:hypothetical protein